MGEKSVSAMTEKEILRQLYERMAEESMLAMPCDELVKVTEAMISVCALLVSI